MPTELLLDRAPTMPISMESVRRRKAMDRYRFLRSLHGRRFPSSYDISNTCNLFCEGCLYFAGGKSESYANLESEDAWDRLFAAEADRGINFCYLSGAEPSLNPERIAAASRHIPTGAVMTNGIKPVDRSIQYRIHISIWGDKDNVAKYRGADTTTKAMRNYQGDPRAIMVMTINSQNIDQIPNVVAQCAEYGMTLTFSYFSSTVDYAKRLRGEDHSDAYIFISTPDDNLKMEREHFAAARKRIEAAMRDYPDTVLYNLHYDDWVTQDAPLYELDENGIATNCGNRLNDSFFHYDVEHNRHEAKCCSPNIDCSDCKAYAMGLGSFVSQQKNLRDIDAFEKWLSVFEFWIRLYMPVDVVEKLG